MDTFPTSIIIPIYQVEKYLAKCLDSALAQTFDDYEIIAVDDGSTDDSGRIADEYALAHPQRIRVIHQQNGGVGAARNTGLKNAKGEYLLFVDSDDTMDAGMLEHLFAQAQRFDADMVICGYRFVEENGAVLSEEREQLPVEQPFTLAKRPEVLQSHHCVWNRLIRKSLFVDQNIVFTPKVRYDDLEAVVELYPFAKCIVYTDALLYNYLRREGSIMNNRNADKNSDIFTAFDGIISFYGERGLFSTYHAELEFLAIRHLFLSASVRVLQIDPRHPLLQKLRAYIDEHFAGYKRNPCLGLLSRRKRIVFRFLNKKRYGMLAALFFARNIPGRAVGRLRRLVRAK
jgi:glycosyltransferase involved in cell wall biosynthesis